MGPRFDETQRGRRFFDAHIPKLIKAIEENTAELKRANDLKEKEQNKKAHILAEIAERTKLDENAALQQFRECFLHDSWD